MKILLVNKFFFIKGGAETVFFQERERLKDAGVEIVDFSMNHSKNKISAYSDYFVKQVDYENKNSIKDKVNLAVKLIYNADACKKMQSLLHKEKPDIVHFHNIYHQLTPALIKVAHDFGCKIVLTAHDYKIACPTYLMFRDGKVCDSCLTGGVSHVLKYRCQSGSFTKSLLLALEAYWQSAANYYSMLDVIITPSIFLRDLLTKKLPSSRIDVIANGTEDNVLTNNIRNDEGYFLYFGRLSKEKGVETVLSAHKKMRNKAVLKIAGTGPLYTELVTKYPDAQFLGYIPQGDKLHHLISHSRAVIQPSVCYENCSMSILEAMSFAKAIIGSRIGGIPEQIRDGVEGMLFEPGNAEELAAAMDFLSSNPGEACEMGARAKTRLSEKYSLNQHIESLLALYNGLMDK